MSRRPRQSVGQTGGRPLYDNLTVRVTEDAALGPLPSYASVRRYLKSHGLFRQARKPLRHTAGTEAASGSRNSEVRSYESAHPNALWHADYHHGVRAPYLHGPGRGPCCWARSTIPPASPVIRDCGAAHWSRYDRTVRHVRDLPRGAYRIYLELEVRRVHCRGCGKVKRERLSLLSNNPFYTRRFAWLIGRRCRSAPVKDVAEEFHLDWDTVKELDKQYMGAQLEGAGTPRPKALGIDEISIRKRQVYRIVVSDLIRGWPICFGGQDRSEESMAQFDEWLGARKIKGIRLAVMDLWKPFRTVTNTAAPQAAVLFDKFHIVRHLSEALDKVRKSEYARLSGRNPSPSSGATAARSGHASSC